MKQNKLESCFRLYAEQAWRLAVYMLSDPHEAFDTVQQAFLVASKKSASIPEENPWPWLRQVVINEARNYRRKNRPAPTESLGDWQIDEKSDPYKSAAKSESMLELRSALSELPEPELEAIVMTALQGLTHQKAADALGIPVKTVSSRVSRGLEKLREKLSGMQESLLASFASMPIIAPPGGFEAAEISWKASAGISATGSATSTIIGGTVLTKKVTTAAVIIMATLIGFGGGIALSPRLSSDDSEKIIPPSTADVASESAKLDLPDEAEDSGEASSRSDNSVVEKASTSTASAGELETVRRERDTLKKEKTTLERTVENLETELKPFRKAQAERGPVFTFGKHGQLQGVTSSNWKMLGDASREVNSNLRKLREAQLKGKKAPREVMIAVQQNTEKMRTYEYDVLGKFPTWAKHNGELTHPLSHSNLIASQLKTIDLPLSESQQLTIEQLGLDYERDYEAAQQGYTKDTPRVKKMYDEYALKGVFVDAVWDLMSIPQRDHFVDEKWHHVASVDLYCPSLMIIHTSPVLAQETRDEMKTDLQARIIKRFQIADEAAAALAPILDTWLSDVDSILDPVAKNMQRYYTFEQSLVAAKAHVKLFESIRDYVSITDDARVQLLDAYGFYVPRIVKSSE